MNSKKLNIFALFMMVVMCAFSIYIGLNNNGKDGINGINGKSSYELALEEGLISNDTTEVEYLKSLYGKEGSSITIEDIYNAYLSEKRKVDPSYDCSMLDFLESNFSDTIKVNTSTLVEYTTQVALRSTVDICYSFYDERPVYQYRTSWSGGGYYESSTPAYGVSAGSGVIYKMDSDTAYIITNYHVVYASNYTNDLTYRVFYDGSEYFTAKISDDGKSFDRDVVPIETHFLNTYDVYLYGYQDSRYKLSATFVGGSADNDIAVLKIEKNSANENNKLLFNGSYIPAQLGDSDELATGEGVVAVGNPLLADTSNIDSSQVSSNEELIQEVYEAYVDAICLTSTSGEVSNVSEFCNFTSLLDDSETINLRLIRVSCAINAGNSGGSLFNLDGKLIGIVNGKIESSSYDNVGYAIPINVASRIADQVISQCEGKTETQIKVLTTSKLEIVVENGESEASYSAGTWTVKNNVVVKTINSSSKFYQKLNVGDIINSIVIDDTTYNLNNYYNLNEILLKVGFKTTSQVVTFNVTSTDGLNVTTKNVDITFEESDFLKIA